MRVVGVLLMFLMVGVVSAQDLTQDLKTHLKKAEKQMSEIPQDRKNILDGIAKYVAESLTEDKKARLLFVCTHNSRRSQMSQAVAEAAAAYYKVPFIYSYSGGTESTAFNPRAVRALKNAGFLISKSDASTKNIKYEVKLHKDGVASTFFSKKYASKHNPQTNFAAVMVCSDADDKCPIVYGADMKFPLTYDDPKAFDDTHKEIAKYAERLNQITTEQMYLFKQVSKQIK